MDDHSPHQDEPSISELSLPSEHPPSYHLAHLASEKTMPLIMAPRTNLQTLVYLLSTTSLWHLLFILTFLIYTAMVARFTYATILLYLGADDWLIDGIFGRGEDPWHAMYRFALEMLSFQTFALVVLYLARFILGIKNAVPDDDDVDDDFGSRIRKWEGSYSRRRLWIVAMATNFLLVYILSSQPEADNWQHRRESMDRGSATATEVVVEAVTVDVVVATVPGDGAVITLTTITHTNSVTITDFGTSSPLPLLNAQL